MASQIIPIIFMFLAGYLSASLYYILLELKKKREQKARMHDLYDLRTCQVLSERRMVE